MRAGLKADVFNLISAFTLPPNFGRCSDGETDAGGGEAPSDHHLTPDFGGPGSECATSEHTNYGITSPASGVIRARMARNHCEGEMIGNWRIPLVVIFFGVAAPAIAAPAPALPAATIPTVQCISRVLKSSSAVQSVSLYSIDGFRFAIEYAFRNKNGHVVVYDIEFIGNSGIVTDKIPREISTETADEAWRLEDRLDLNSKCNLRYAGDNLYPEAAARADWQKIELPGK
jgi:hypothetical protein